MTKIFGFKTETSDSVKKEESQEQLAEHIEEDLKKDLKLCEKFKAFLRKELKTLDDLETHLLALAEQADSVKKLMEKRKELMKKLFIELNKKSSDLNIEFCEKYLEILRNLDGHLGNLIQTSLTELKKFVIHDAHDLYAASEDNRIRMNELSEWSKELSAELNLFYAEFNSSIQQINEIYPHLESIKDERAEKEKTKIGFK